eukprot:jgi/Orpsp1_1/1184206/evm.model.c7180000088502.2
MHDKSPDSIKSDMIKYLQSIQFIDFKKKVDGIYPIFIAIEKKYYNVLYYLLSKKVTLTHRNSKNETVMDVAKRVGDPYIIKLISEQKEWIDFEKKLKEKLNEEKVKEEDDINININNDNDNDNDNEENNKNSSTEKFEIEKAIEEKALQKEKAEINEKEKETTEEINKKGTEIIETIENIQQQLDRTQQLVELQYQNEENSNQELRNQPNESQDINSNLNDLRNQLQTVMGHINSQQAMYETNIANLNTIITSLLSDALRNTMAIKGYNENELNDEKIESLRMNVNRSNYLWLARNLPQTIWNNVKVLAEKRDQHYGDLPHVPEGVLPDTLQNITPFYDEQ